MKFIDFIDTYREPIFTLQDLEILGLKISTVQLSQWSKKGYLIKIRNGVYVFSERKNSLSLETLSHFIYEPSYISLERALFQYGLIPEMVYGSTAITTRKTATFENAFGVFVFRNIKKELFFGYTKIAEGNNVYFLAEKEKALLDYLYLNSSKINNLDDINELRLNETVLKEFEQKKLGDYGKIFDSKKLDKICKLIFKNYANF